MRTASSSKPGQRFCPDVQAAAQSFYRSLADDLQSHRGELGQGIQVLASEGSWSRVGLYRDSWPSDAGGPKVYVGFEMHKSADFETGDRKAGVFCDRDSDSGQAVHATVLRATATGAESGFTRSSPWWPAYRDLPSPSEPDYWTDLTPYRRELIDLILSAWTHLAPLVDGALGDESPERV